MTCSRWKVAGTKRVGEGEGNIRAELESDKVLDVVEDALAFLNCRPAAQITVCSNFNT